jgi:uncharacterized membrane protein YfcA
MLDFVALLLLAFFMESVDNSLGGGFGTILSPLLVILGFDAKVVVPAILVSEMISGLWGGFWHWHFKNVNWKAVGFTLLGSLIAMGLATYVMAALLSPSLLKYVISVFAVIMGIFVIIRSYLVKKLEQRQNRHNPLWFSVMGFLIGYQKGTSGGNYGPFSVTGYMVWGLSAATAIGTTTVAEGIACTLGVAMYSQMTGIVLSIAAALAIGSFIADPISAWMNNHLKNKLKPPFHGRLIGLAMTLIGLIALLKTFGIIGV